MKKTMFIVMLIITLGLVTYIILKGTGKCPFKNSDAPERIRDSNTNPMIIGGGCNSLPPGLRDDCENKAKLSKALTPFPSVEDCPPERIFSGGIAGGFLCMPEIQS